MIKKLQRKFIFSAMLAITILLVFLLGALNIENAHMSKKQNEQVIDTLLNNENMKPLPHMDKKTKGFLSVPINENAKFSTVYFTVRTDDAENIISTDVSHIASVSEKDAEEIFIKITKKNSNEGKIQNFRYKSTVNMHDNTKIYLFIDTTMQT
ncbi:MAG: hypothetical protein K2J59_00570, partial [Eubacterium sp.]|nr:hypothetical protein [Eubacterium sp.]